MTDVLCITGMHRSGTSLVASWLERCHLVISDGRMLGPGVGNLHGHFEDLDFSEIQDRVIKRAHGSWRATTSQPLSFNPGEVEEVTRLIARRSAVYPLWGWKDPRTVLFLQEWKRLIPGLKVLIVWRPCAEVVESLMERACDASSDLDLAIGALESVRVWWNYNTAACAFTRACPDDVMLVPIASLLRDDRSVIDELNRRWHLTLHYTPIRHVRDEMLLNRRATTETLSSIGARLRQIRPLEQTLQHLSWSPADHSGGRGPDQPPV